MGNKNTLGRRDFVKLTSGAAVMMTATPMAFIPTKNLETSMNKTPDRIIRLKDELYAAQPVKCFERASIVTQSFKRTEGEHFAIRRAKSLRDVFNNIPIFIRQGELLAGHNSSVLAGQPVYPEFKLDGFSRESLPHEIWDYWNGNTIADIVNKAYPESIHQVESEWASGIVVGYNSGFGHVIIDYEKAIKRGFRSIIAEAETGLTSITEDDEEGRAFLQSVIISAKGIIEWAERYAELAHSEAEKENDPIRRKELLRIEDTCRRVPAEPARTFAEALQSFWFVHLAMHIEQNGWSISAGRFDQYMYPYFKQDIDSGIASREDQWELLLSLWVKAMENAPWGVKSTIFQNLTIGGKDIEGNDQSNELSHMCLDATVALCFNQPAITVRWHKNINPVFWDHVNSTIAKGMGLPALFNDEVIIPALVKHGVSLEDAVGYGIVGCVESCVPGKQQGVTAGGHVNCAKALELSLNNGKSMLSGKQIGIETGEPRDFKGFEDLWSAYKKQMEYIAGINVLATQITGEIQKKYGYCPLMSSLLDDCIASKRDMVHGSTRYNLGGVGVFGPTNTCDGMMAIKKWVCEEKRVSWEDLQNILLSDYEGYEEIRQLFINKTPRFGNDIIEADEMYNKIMAVHADFFDKQTDPRGGGYTCGVWPVNNHVETGKLTAATPDGRHKCAPLVDGVGACQGADKAGPTALIKSAARINNIDHWPAGNTFNIKFSAASVNSYDGVSQLSGLTTTFMKLGGQELQVNVVDSQTLKAAMKSPEQYSDLIVRVAGYSGYFTTLRPDIQEEIVSRIEQNV